MGYNTTKFKIVDEMGIEINPATEEKQDAIITALGNVKIDTGDIDLNTDGLEQLLTDIKDKQLPDNHQVTVSNIANTPVITGFSTSAKQDSQITLETTLNSLVGTLQILTQRLEVIASMANSGAPALRTIPIASVSTAVTGSLTTVTNLTNLTNFGTASPAKEVADDVNNSTAILANINNVVVS